MDVSSLYFWIAIGAALGALGRFVDYLLNTRLRNNERDWVRSKFATLFERVNAVDLFSLQLLMVSYFMRIKEWLFGKQLLSPRSILISLLISQYLTVSALFLWTFTPDSEFVGRPLDISGFQYLVPLFPFTGLIPFTMLGDPRVTSALESSGLYWNNYLFDSLTILATFKLMTFVQHQQKYFWVAALADLCLSYLLAFCCIAAFTLTPPNSNLLGVTLLAFGPDMNRTGNFGDRIR